MSRPKRPDFILPKLTELEQARSNHILQVRRRIEELQAQIRMAVALCDHVFIPNSAKRKNPYEWLPWCDRWEINDYGVCLVCGTISENWYCETSPTKMCEYMDDDHVQDFCIHCENPEERK